MKSSGISGIGKNKMRDKTLSQQQVSQSKRSLILNSNAKISQKYKKAKENKAKYDEVDASQIVSLTDIVSMNFETIKLKGRFSKLLGEPYRPFYIMAYGLPYNGKSSVALLLADDLMKYHKLKVLYVMNEEGVKAGLQEKVTRLKVTSPIDVVENFSPDQFKGYDVVALDSIQTCNMTPVDFALLKKRYPHTSFILVSKANKDGTFKGSSDWEHDVDAMLEVKDKCVTIGKNRFPNATESTVKAF